LILAESVVNKTLKTIVGAFLILVSILSLVVSIAAFSDQHSSHVGAGFATLAAGAAGMYGSFRVLAEPHTRGDA
jgi:hypothetical protein